MSSPIQLLDLSQARIRSSEGAGTTTLTIDDFRHQVFNLSAARTVVLPTTGVKKGMKWVIENQGAFTLTVQSSNATTLATVQGTRFIGEALIDSPTTAAHWIVSNIGEIISGNSAATWTTSLTGVQSLVLTPGNWMVSANAAIEANTTDRLSIMTLSTTSGGTGSYILGTKQQAAYNTSNGGMGMALPPVPFNFPSGGTVWVSVQTTSVSGIGTCGVRIQAVRYT